MKALSAIAKLSHELRSPLCVIKEGIYLILNGCDGPITENQKENERRDASTSDDCGVGGHRSTWPTGLAIEHSGQGKDREPEHHSALQIAFEAEQSHY